MPDNPHRERAVSLETAAPTVPYPEPLARIGEALNTKRWICDLVETIADSLPEASSLICLRAAAVLRNDLPLYQADVGRYLFPQLRLRNADQKWIALLLSQIETDHQQLEICIDEVADLLERIGEGHARLQERTVAGYALRCFFDGLRRHISWEQNLILPLANESLTQADLRMIAEGIEQNRRSRPRGPAARACRQID